MATRIPDPFDEWAPRLQAAVMEAARKWSETMLERVFPKSLVAAGEGVQMNLDAFLFGTGDWIKHFDDEVLPVILAFLTAQTIDVASVREVDLRPLVATNTSPTETRAVFAEAVDYLGRMGYAAEDIEIVVTRRTWIDFADAQAAKSRNLVVGMPENMYRELVGKLATATNEGAGQFDRNLIVRDFLDMNREGGFEAWNTRAERIARTETQRTINAATMEAARMEQSVTGEPLRKAWVATMDTRTRDRHFEADGQIVPLDGKFDIGGFEADHPGDEALPAHLSINCRCTTVLLGEGEELPGETDRQTERARRSKAEDGQTRSPAAEVRRRAREGVTRDRDNGEVITAATTGRETMRREWAGMLAPIGKESGDGRRLEEGGDFTFREFPLPLMYQREQSMGHDTSVIVGKITGGTIDGSGIHAEGVLFDTYEAEEAINLLREGVIRPSVDLSDMEVEHVVLDADGNEVDIAEGVDDDADVDGWREEMRVRASKVMGATLVAKPAFAEAKITLGDEVEDESGATTGAELESLAAAAAVATRFDSSAFAPPRLEAPTPLTVDGDIVFGHLALWDTEHVGFPGQSVTPPKSATDYAMFHVSQVETERGGVAVGRLTVGTGHAGANDSMNAAAEHYDTTGTTWAYVRAGEDKFGIWVSGMVNPDASEAQIRAGASAPLSGDWRRVGGNLELVAALSVNTPGFPVPRTFSDGRNETMSIVAAAVLPRSSKHESMVAAVREGLRLHREEEAALEAERKRAAEARRMAASVIASGIGRGVK